MPLPAPFTLQTFPPGATVPTGRRRPRMPGEADQCYFYIPLTGETIDLRPQGCDPATVIETIEPTFQNLLLWPSIVVRIRDATCRSLQYPGAPPGSDVDCANLGALAAYHAEIGAVDPPPNAIPAEFDVASAVVESALRPPVPQPAPPPPPTPPQEPMMGFFDDLLGTATSAVGAVGEALAGAGGILAQVATPVIQAATANPAAVAQALQAFGVLPTPSATQMNLAASLQAALGGQQMPINPDTGSVNMLAQQAGTSLASILNSLPQILRQTLPGAVGGIAGGGAAELGVEAINYLFGGGSSGCGSGTQVIALPAGQRPPRRVVFQRPDGRQFEFTSRGRPLLYSGDVTATKRVTRAASRARRARPRRRYAPALPAPTHVVCSKCLTSPCGCG